MIWLLQLANLQCPCLGLVSNELRALLFSWIKGTMKEASQFLPPEGRQLAGLFSLACDCPPRHSVPLGWGGYSRDSQDIKTWVGERKRVRLLQSLKAEEAGTVLRVASNQSFNHFFLLPFPPAAAHKSFTPSPCSFLLSVIASLWAVPIFIASLTHCILEVL